MLTREKTTELVTNLLKRTQEGALTWGETAEEFTFRVVLSTGIVRVGRHENPVAHSGGPELPFGLPRDFRSSSKFIYSLFLLDDHSRELDRFITTNQDDEDLMEPLWQLAFSSTRNADKKIDNILRELLTKATK